MTEETIEIQTGSCGVSPRMLELLICPVTGGPLIFDREACELISRKAKLAFPIRDGLPIMLESEARDLET
ncbi:MAG: Trm112 family protein [Pseudomonadota bacterium]